MAGKAKPTVIVDGKSVGPITMLSLDQPWNGHHSFAVTCRLREKSNAMLDLARQYVGKPITIQMRADIRSSSGQLDFYGLVTNIKLSKHDNTDADLVLQGFSPTRLLDDGPHHRSFSEQSLEDIARTVCGEFSELNTHFDISDKDPLPYVTQYRETAYHFLRRLFTTHGQWAYYDGERFVGGAPPEGGELLLSFGRELTSLDLSADLQPANFKLLGYDYVADEHLQVSANGADVPGLDDVSRTLLDTATQVFQYEPSFAEPVAATAQPHLERQAVRRRAGRSAGSVNLFASSARLDLRVGQVIKVQALPTTLGGGASLVPADYGSFRILHLSHFCDGSGNYHNTFQAIPARLEIPPIGDAQIQPPPAEPQPATVVDNRDPEELGRIKVQFPWQADTGDQTPWLRVAAAGAGGGHGAYFVPEIGDQVMVGFEYNNPDRPVVMGSLYHGKVKPPNAADPDNNSKIIRTRSGNQIILSDASSEESITIVNGTNKITLSLSGSTSIDIATEGDMTFTAKSVTFKVKGMFLVDSGDQAYLKTQNSSLGVGRFINMESKKDVAIKGQNIKLDAQMALSGKAVQKAEFTSMNTTVKGDVNVSVTAPMVKLN